MSKHNPLDALRAWKAQRKAAGRNPHSLKVVGPEIAPAYTNTPAIQPFCLHLKSWAAGTSVLPDDFDTVERSSRGLRTHIRPDGAMYLGAFEFAGDEDGLGVIVVYGDPKMPIEEGREHARRFRHQLFKQMDDFDAHKSLGPFAGKPTHTE